MRLAPVQVESNWKLTPLGEGAVVASDERGDDEADAG
jgi:hypothetical protein